MIITDLVSALRSASVHVWVDGDRLRYRAARGAYTPDLRAAVSDRRTDLIEALRAPEPNDVPTCNRRRASWLGDLAREVDVTVEDLFDLIDELHGHRAIGPYALSPDETLEVVRELQVRHGPIILASSANAPEPEDDR